MANVTKLKPALRGSSKLFDLEPDDHSALAKALGVAREKYEIKWWWKYGQPAIDRVTASGLTKPGNLGSVLEQVMKLNSRELQVTASCFPYGIPVPDYYRVEVEARRNF